MNTSPVKFSIAFSEKKIALYEKGDKGLWSICEELHVPDEDIETVSDRFTQKVESWREQAREFDVWFSSDFCAKIGAAPEKFSQNDLTFLEDDEKEIIVFSSENEAHHLIIARSVYFEAYELLISNQLKLAQLSHYEPKPNVRPTKLISTKSPKTYQRQGEEWVLMKNQNALVPLDDDGKNSYALVLHEARPTDIGNPFKQKSGLIALGIGASLLILVSTIALINVSNSPEETGPSFDTSEAFVEPQGLETISDAQPKEPEPIYEGAFEVADTYYAYRPEGHAVGNPEAYTGEPEFVKNSKVLTFEDRPSNHEEHANDVLRTREDVPLDRDGERVESVAKRTNALEEAVPEFLNEPNEGFEGNLPPIYGDLPRNSLSGREAGNIATNENAIDLSDIVLLGIYGAIGNPEALLRAPDGQTKSVSKGDLIAGWQVVAISRSEVIISNGSAQRRLNVPN